MKCPKDIADKASTEWDKKNRCFSTTLPDGITVGWDTCGRCDKHYRACGCFSIHLPRHVVSLRADAVKRGFVVSEESAEPSDDASGGSLQPDDSEPSQTDSDGTTALESFECPAEDCSAIVTEAHTVCPECGIEFEWEDEEEEMTA